MADIQYIVKKGEISVASIASELGLQPGFVDICSTLLSPMPLFRSRLSTASFLDHETEA